jgi:magnesium transporter
MLTIRHFDAGQCTRVDPALLVTEALPATGWFWVDMSHASGPESDVLARIGVHPLIIEDMRDDRHLPKVEVLGNQVSLTVHGLRIGGRDPGSAHDPEGELTTAELDIALVDRFLVTYHDRDMHAVTAVAHHLDHGGAGELDRPVLLLHRLLDTLNDVMVPFIDHFEHRLDIVEDDLLTDPTEATRDDLYRMQRDIIQLRRVVVPQAEVLRRLARDATTVMSDWFHPDDLALMRDVHDHLYRMAGLSESYQQLVDSAMSSYRAAQDDRLNEMLRVLTLISALLLPISVVAGIYGTNFVDLPGSRSPWGFAVMLGSFAIVVVGMLAWFRQRGWIGGAAEQAAADRRISLRRTIDVPVLGTVLKVPVSGARAVGRGTRAVGRGTRHIGQRITGQARPGSVEDADPDA